MPCAFNYLNFTECALWRVNKREHGNDSIYTQKLYIYCGAYICLCIWLHIVNITNIILMFRNNLKLYDCQQGLHLYRLAFV